VETMNPRLGKYHNDNCDLRFYGGSCTCMDNGRGGK